MYVCGVCLCVVCFFLFFCFLCACFQSVQDCGMKVRFLVVAYNEYCILYYFTGHPCSDFEQVVSRLFAAYFTTDIPRHVFACGHSRVKRARQYKRHCNTLYYSFQKVPSPPVSFSGQSVCTELTAAFSALIVYILKHVIGSSYQASLCFICMVAEQSSEIGSWSMDGPTHTSSCMCVVGVSSEATHMGNSGFASSSPWDHT